MILVDRLEKLRHLHTVVATIDGACGKHERVPIFLFPFSTVEVLIYTRYVITAVMIIYFESGPGKSYF